MTATPSPDAPTEPSKGDNGLTQAARSLLTELQSIMLGDEATPDPEAMSAICVALDRFRAAGVRQEQERALAIVDNYCISISSLTEVAQTVRTNLGFVAEAIRSGGSP